MPKLKIERVISFSSEDNVHVADNILNEDSKKKWLCKTAGEKSAIIILQLENPSFITGLDIGNEHSAFIEVLVGRSTFNDTEYKVILTTSSFMTPLDSRQSQNINRVRMFSTENFCKSVCDERWDRVKIVCTQPFNKHVQYGLSFVIIHSSENKNTENNSVPAVLKLGKFKILPESPKDEIVAGSLFMKRKELENEKPLTAAAAIRDSSPIHIFENKTQASKPTKLTPGTSSPKLVDIEKVQRNRTQIFYDDEDSASNEKIDSIMYKHKKEKINNQDVENVGEDDRKILNKKCNDEYNTTRDTKTAQVAGTSKKHTLESCSEKPKKKKRVIRSKPFSELFTGVVFVISGYQNPFRSEIRGKALEMGGKYRTDWSSDSTHLICAFSNTPKYHQVQGHGKIVTGKWIEDCYSNRKRLPWRRYALNPKEKNKPESENEILDEDLILNEEEVSSTTTQKTYNISDSDNENEAESVEPQNRDETEASNEGVSSNTNTKTDNFLQNIYDKDTDEEELIEPNIINELNSLPNFFSNDNFYIDELLDDVDLLKRYIIAYDGTIVSDVKDCKYFITENKQEANKICSETFQILFVKPLWIYSCHEEKSKIPHDDYLLDA